VHLLKIIFHVALNGATNKRLDTGKDALKSQFQLLALESFSLPNDSRYMLRFQKLLNGFRDRLYVF
jgi:hypothetical protein